MSSDEKDPGPGRDEVGQAEQAASDLKDQMTQLKARYRAERRLLETRSFEPPENADEAQQGLATRPPPVR